MFHSKFLIILSITALALFVSSASADVSFGQGYTCSGNQIINSKGKVQKFSKFKVKANAKIDSLKLALFAAKKRKQANKVLLLTNNLNTQKVLLQNARLCSNGNLTESPTPTPTPDSGSRPEREKPSKPGDKVRG